MLLNKFLRLPAADRRLIVECAGLLFGIRTALSLVPFGSLLARISRDRAADAIPAPTGLENIVWSIETVSRYLPFVKSCLTKALAAKFLLDRRGYCSSLRIGVAKAGNGALEAHAWIERGSTVVIGGTQSSVQRFQLLAGPAGTQVLS